MLSPKLQQQIRIIYQQVKHHLPNFKPRSSQNKLIAEMANIIAGSYHNYDRIGLVEAGTGTGKSLAYLLASIPYALANNKRVVIATATVALQEQLVNKDLPLFRKASELQFEFCLVKGRLRYACIERLKQLLKTPPLWLDAVMLKELEQLLQAWENRKWLGDRDTLPAGFDENLWQQLAADPFTCHKADYHHHDCPFHLARAEIAGSEILVVNHALLLADLESGNTVLPLPEDTIYIIDEAHHLPECGKDFFSASAALNQHKSWLEQAEKTAIRLQDTLPESALKDLLKYRDCCQELTKTLVPIEHSVTELSGKWFKEKNEYRFSDAQLPQIFQKHALRLSELSKQCQHLTEKLHQTLLEHTITEQYKPSQQYLSMQQALSGFSRRLEQLAALWQAYSQPQQIPAAQARWVSLQQSSVIASSSPLYIGHRLEQLLFSEAFACLLCSATLTTLGSFNYIKQELGLTQHEGLRTLQVASPFAHEEKGVLIIPRMQTDPTAEEFTDELITVLPRYLPEEQASLVLFTSYWQMQQVATALRQQGFSLLVQGEAPRQSLLQLHSQNCRHHLTSILFGTQSFSEGLDLPGNLLTNLVITKLPFAVPTSPLEEAMSEAISRKGGNAFLQLTIPKTSTKLVQSCGRLLRQEQDQGQIVILDRRLLTKSYGASMLNALPPFRRQIEY